MEGGGVRVRMFVSACFGEFLSAWVIPARALTLVCVDPGGAGRGGEAHVVRHATHAAHHREARAEELISGEREPDGEHDEPEQQQQHCQLCVQRQTASGAGGSARGRASPRRVPRA